MIHSTGRLSLESRTPQGPYDIIFVRERPDVDGRRQCDFICPSCHKTFTACLYNVRSGNTKQCASCGKRTMGKKFTPDLVGQKFGKLTVLRQSENHANNKAHWVCKCDCGTIIETPTTSALRSGNTTSCGCVHSDRNCNGYQNIDGQQFGYWKALYPSERLNKYGKKTYYWCECLNCGSVCEVPKVNLTCGISRSCGCISSYGEKRISELLTSMNICYQKEKTFDTCRNPETNRMLRFDFYLPDYNCCIEYDGQQHFSKEGGCWNATDDEIQDSWNRDKIKDKWCENNHIRLIRIPYVDYDSLNENYINNILERK